MAHTLATFTEQCSFRYKVNPYPCDEFLWGKDGVFTRYMNENPAFFFTFMQLFKNGKTYDGWNEPFRQFYVEDSIKKLANAETTDGVDLQYLIAFYFVDILNYDNGLEILKNDTQYVKNMMWDIYEGFSQEICNLHHNKLLLDYCGDSALGILMERIDTQATQVILKILENY